MDGFGSGRELRHLPAPQRQAVLLRYVEGYSEREAARIAGCPVGTLSQRTSRGIDRLRQRMIGCHRAIAAPALIGLLETEAQAPVVPKTILSSLTTAAQSHATHEIASSIVSAQVAELAKGVLNMMFWSSVKTAVVAVVAAVVAAGSGAMVLSRDVRLENHKPRLNHVLLLRHWNAVL